MGVLAIRNQTSDFTEIGAFPRKLANFCRQNYPKLNNKKYLSWIVILALLLSYPKNLQGQYAKIKYITAKTAEGVSVSIWIESQIVRFGQDVVVKYKFDNLSSKTIYLVHEKRLNVQAENGIISIGSPSPYPINHGGFDYSFTEIISGKSHQGRLTVPGSSYQGTGPWRI